MHHRASFLLHLSRPEFRLNTAMVGLRLFAYYALAVRGVIKQCCDPSVHASVPFVRWLHGMPASNCHRRGVAYRFGEAVWPKQIEMPKSYPQHFDKIHNNSTTRYRTNPRQIHNKPTNVVRACLLSGCLPSGQYILPLFFYFQWSHQDVWTDIHQIFTFGKNIGMDERPDLLFAIDQGTLLWQPIWWPNRRNLCAPPSFIALLF